MSRDDTSEWRMHKAVFGDRPAVNCQLQDEAVLGVTKARDGGPPERRRAGVAVCSTALRTGAGKAAAAQVLEALGITGGAS
jgi:hypothetical protein